MTWNFGQLDNRIASPQSIATHLPMAAAGAPRPFSVIALLSVRGKIEVLLNSPWAFDKETGREIMFCKNWAFRPG